MYMYLDAESWTHRHGGSGIANGPRCAAYVSRTYGTRFPLRLPIPDTDTETDIVEARSVSPFAPPERSLHPRALPRTACASCVLEDGALVPDASGARPSPRAKFAGARC